MTLAHGWDKKHWEVFVDRRKEVKITREALKILHPALTGREKPLMTANQMAKMAVSMVKHFKPLPKGIF